MMKKWLLIFDCDGTLVNSEPLLAQEMSTTFQQINIPFVPTDYLWHYRGIAFPFILSEMLARYQMDLAMDQCQQLEQEMRTRLLMRFESELQPTAGIIEALGQLANFNCCVASNSPLNKIQLALSVTHLAPFFQRLFSGYQLQLWKPDPRFYAEVANQLHYPIERCVVIDDAAAGLQSAIAGGFTTIHYNQLDFQETTPSGALTIHQMQELPALIHDLTQQFHEIS